MGDNTVVVSDSNQHHYEVKGTCREGIAEFVIESPLPMQTVSCVGGEWSAEVDFSGSQDGTVEVVISPVDPKNDKPVVIEFSKDTQPPVITQVTLNGGKPYINTTSLPFLIQEQGQDFHEIRFSESATCDPANAWVSSKSGVTLISSGEGLKNLFYQVRDKAGNTTACVATTVTTSTAVVTLDTTPPQITGLADDLLVQPSKSWTWDCSDPSELCQFRYLITTSNAVANFTGDFNSTQAAVAPTLDGTHYLHVQARDRAGNISTTKIVSAVISTTLPGLSMVAEGRLYHNSRTVDLIPKNHSLFDQVDIFDGGTCTGAAESLSLANGSLQKIFASDGLKTISYRFENTASLAQSSCAQTSITIDTVRPTVTVTSVDAAVTNSAMISVAVTFSESVTGFVAQDVTIVNGTISNFSGSGTNYSFGVTPSAQGEVRISVAENGAVDVASNGNEASAVLIRTFDTLAPVITVTPPTKLVMKASDTLTWAFGMVDSHSMSFGASDPALEFVSGTGTGCAISHTNDTTNLLNLTQEVSLTGCTGDATLQVRVTSSTVTDLAGNTNSSSALYTITVDNTRPVISFSAPSPTEGKVGTVFTWRVSTADKIPIALAQSHIEIMGTTTSKVGCHISAITKVDEEHSDVSVTGCENDGTVSIRVLADSVADPAGNRNLVSSNSTTVKLKNSPKIIGFKYANRTYKSQSFPFVSWSYDKTWGAEIAKFEARVSCNNCPAQTDWIDLGTQTTWALPTALNLNFNQGYWVRIRATDVNGKTNETSGTTGDSYRYWAPAASDNYEGLVSGRVLTSVKDSAGGRIVAGNFKEVVTSSRPVNDLVLFKPNGEIDVNFKIQEILNGSINFYARQSDGKFIVSGSFTHVGTTLSSGLARFNADGSLDNSFPVDVGFTNVPSKFVILNDGRILVYVSQTYEASYKGILIKQMVLLSSTGELLQTFDSPDGTHNLGDIYQQSDGKIIAAGYSKTNKPVIFRLNADLTVDESFQIGTSDGSFGSMLKFTVLPDGKIVVFGTFTKFNEQAAGKIVRLQANGALDNSFQSGTGFPGYIGVLRMFSDANYIYLAQSGSFTYNGQSYTNSGTGLVRMNHDGTMNPLVATGYTFVSGDHFVDGQGGIRIFGKITRGSEELTHVRILSDGSLDATYLTGKTRLARRYVAGSPVAHTTTNMKAIPEGVVTWGIDSLEEVKTVGHIARFAADGSFDEVFAANIGTGFSGQVYKMEKDPSGRILVAGDFGSLNGVWSSYGVVRLFEDGARDNSFVSPNYYSPVMDMALLSSGQIALLGMPSWGPDILVLPANGSTTFTKIMLNDTSTVTGAIIRDVKIASMNSSAGAPGIAIAVNFAQYDSYYGRYTKDEDAILFWVNQNLVGRTDLLTSVPSASRPSRIHAMYDSSNILHVVSSTLAQYYDYQLGYLPTKNLSHLKIYKYGASDLDTVITGSGSGSSSNPPLAWEAEYTSSSFFNNKVAVLGRVNTIDSLEYDGKTILKGINLQETHISLDADNQLFYSSNQGVFHRNVGIYQKPMCILSP